MTAPVSPSDDRDPVLAADVLGDILRALQPPTGGVGNLLAPQDRRIRKALRAAQKALREPEVNTLDAAAADRALAAIRREYQRHP